MNAYEIGNKISQRFFWGSSVHHPSLSTAYEALGIHQLADMNKHAAIKETKKRLSVDSMIVDETGRIPYYSFPQWPSAMQIIGHMTKEQIQQNKINLLKQLIELQENYEKETLKMLEQLKEIGKEMGEGMKHFIAKSIESVKEELQEIELTKQAMEKLGFDPEKMKKGEHKMYGEHEQDMHDRHAHEQDEMRRRHHAEMRRHRYRHHSAYGYDTGRGYGDIDLPIHADYDHHDAEMYRRRHYRHHR